MYKLEGELNRKRYIIRNEYNLYNVYDVCPYSHRDTLLNQFKTFEEAKNYIKEIRSVDKSKFDEKIKEYVEKINDGFNESNG